MLIDARQKGWILATTGLGLLATIVYVWVDRRTPGGVTGSTVAGMWFGIIGSALMIYAGLLSALRKVPSWWWIGARKTWLKGHIWLGLLSWLFILFHSGFRLGGTLEQVLWVVLTLTILTGVVGLVLQQVLPSMMLRRIKSEVPYEQIPHLCTFLRRKADAAVDALCGPYDASAASASRDDSAGSRLRKFYEDELRPFLGEPFRRTSMLTRTGALEEQFAMIGALSWPTDVRADLAYLNEICEERKQLGEQERLHQLLHGWLVLHIPLSAALLVLGMVHAVLSMYY